MNKIINILLTLLFITAMGTPSQGITEIGDDITIPGYFNGWINKSWIVNLTEITDHGELTGLEDNDHPQYAINSSFINHTINTNNPHAVTLAQIGSDNTKVNKTGDTMTGILSVPHITITNSSGVTTYGYNAGIGNTKTYQTAIGYNAGYQNTGATETAMGYQAGYQNSGIYQSAFGGYAGYSNTGTYQTALGYYAGRSNIGTYQTAIGYYAGYQNTGNEEIVIGYNAGYQNTAAYQMAIGTNAGYQNSGVSQTAVGTYAGSLNSGTYQTAMGYGAGRSNNQTYQTVFGYNAGRENIGLFQHAYGGYAGYQNKAHYQTVFGASAGRNNLGSYQNSFGNNAGYQNSGNYQSSFGNQAGYQNTGESQNAMGNYAGTLNSGSYQTAIGSYSGTANAGNDQTAIGYYAGYNNIGDNQIAIGVQAGMSNIGDNSIFIGKDAGNANTLDHRFVVANSPSNSSSLINGNFSTGQVNITHGSLDISDTLMAGLSQSSQNNAVCYNTTTRELTYNSGLTTCLASSINVKTNVTNITQNLTDKIMAIRPIKYDSNNITNYGFIAEEIETLFPELVGREELFDKVIRYNKPTNDTITYHTNFRQGNITGIKYENTVAILTKVIQEQQLKIEAQEKTIAAICKNQPALCIP